MPTYAVSYTRVIEDALDEEDAKDRFRDELGDIDIYDQDYEVAEL